MKKVSWLLLFCSSLVQAQQSPAPFFYSPADFRTREGDAEEVFPFAIGSSRFQQVYEAFEFAALEPYGGGWVNNLFFRLDTTFGKTFLATLPELQINFSTTQQGPDSLSPVFAENVGPDDTVAFRRGPLEMFSFKSIGEPQGWAILIHLSDPFFYNPANGNLLMDVRVYQDPTADVPYFDAWDRVGDSVGSVRAYPLDSVSGTANSLGLATRLNIGVIPEPSTLSMMLLGTLMTGALLGLSKLRWRAWTRAWPNHLGVITAPDNHRLHRPRDEL